MREQAFAYDARHTRTDVLIMVNPLLTLAFDLSVICSAGVLLYAAIAEHRRSQRGVVATGRRFRVRQVTGRRERGVTASGSRRKLAA